MTQDQNVFSLRKNRRSFLRNGIVAAGAATVGTGLLVGEVPVFAQEGPEEGSGTLTRGDAAILRFLAAAEIIETDLWQQYNELGGVNGGNPAYIAALQILDGDMPQYITDNTDDEISHAAFLNAYLQSRGAEPVDLEKFPRLPNSQATGARQGGEPR